MSYAAGTQVPAVLISGFFNSNEATALLTFLRSVIDGEMAITIDGIERLTGRISRFPVQTDLHGCAQLVQDALAPHTSSVIWDEAGGVFRVYTTSTGPTSTISRARPPPGGTDISAPMRLDTAGQAVTVQGGDKLVSLDTLDSADGTLESGKQTFVKCRGLLVIVVGDRVAPHGSGIHAVAVMKEGSHFVRINGIPVCRHGDLASCGHIATGSSNVTISGAPVGIR